VDLSKNSLLPLEPKLLVICGRIGEAQKMVYSAYQFVKTEPLAPRAGVHARKF
jgi:hypothetical protein